MTASPGDDRVLRECEYVGDSGLPECRRIAVFLVGTGTRKADAQKSCRMHLAATAYAFARQDGGWYKVTVEVIGGPS